MSVARRLPWEDLNTPVILAHEVKKRKQWVTVGAWILVAMLLITGITRRNILGLFFAALLALTLVSKKTVAVTERGLETFMDMRFLTNYDIWKWEDISALTHQKIDQFPGATQLYFSKGDMARRVFFLDKDSKQVIVLARKKNSLIKIHDGNAYMKQRSKGH